MRELSLFSGAGGGLLASRLLGWRTIGYVEFNDYCQRVIAARIRDGRLPMAPIFSDVEAFVREGYAEQYQGVVDVVSGGFPCQPFSVAGRRAAADDPRNMWPQTAAVLRAVRPRFAFLENVPGLLSGAHGYFGHVLGELAEMGFDARWCVLGAADVGAPHLRKRLWILGTAQGATADTQRVELREQRQRDREQRGESRAAQSGDDGQAEPVAHPNGHRQPQPEGSVPLQRGWPSDRSETLTDAHSIDEDRTGHGPGDVLGLKRTAPTVLKSHVANSAGSGQSDPQGSDEFPRPRRRSEPADCGWWNTEPDVGRVAHGVASRVDRLKAIGNGQVPIVAATAWRLLSGL